MRKLNRSLGGFFDILRGLCVARIGLGRGGRRRPRAVKETTLTLTLALALALTLTQVANVSLEKKRLTAEAHWEFRCVGIPQMGKVFIEAEPSTSTPFFPGLGAARDDPLLGKKKKPAAADRDRRGSRRLDNLKHMEVLTAECAQMAGPAKPAGVSASCVCGCSCPG